jgi:hypothetical protein
LLDYRIETAIGPVVIFVLLVSAGNVAFAQQFGIKEITYAEIEEFTKLAIDFDQSGRGDIDGIFSESGVSFAERFEGQSLKIKQDDRLVRHETLDDESPNSPLRLVPGLAGHNLAVGYDKHWGSQALLPLGPHLSGRDGTGALAIFFDEPVCFVAFRTAIDGLSRYANVNSSILRGKEEGSLNIRFYNAEGQQLASFMRSYNPEGPIEVGYMQSGQAVAQISGIFMQNLDLGGIAIDDFRFDPNCPTKLF